MTTTTTRYQEFEFGATFLKNVFEWVSENADLEDIFSHNTKKVIEFVKDHNIQIQEIFELEDVLDYIAEKECRPEEIFDKETLEKWAKGNGFKK